MTRVCSKCNFENQDDYDFCAKCGNPLIEGVKPNNLLIYNTQPRIRWKIIILSYIITILLSWGGFLINFISKNSKFGFFAFFGFFLPFFLMQSPYNEIRRHGYIQLFISTIGIILSLYVLLN